MPRNPRADVPRDAGRDLYVRACLKIRRGAVFAAGAGWQGATRENTRDGSSTEEQRGQAAPAAKTLRAAVLLKPDFVVASPAARCGDAGLAPPRPAPKSPAAAPLPIFRQALKEPGGREAPVTSTTSAANSGERTIAIRPTRRRPVAPPPASTPACPRVFRVLRR